jgi:methionyl-tRNA synthetase
MLLGDSIARWHRAKGDDVFFMAGTDEHGAKVEEAAQKAGFSSTLAFCDEVSKSFQDAWKQFDISHDAFLRTTSAEHRDSVQHIWRVLEQRGYIYKGQHEGWYCRSDEAFVPETQLLKVPVQEGRPASAPAGEGLEWRTASGHAVERISEDNYKFRLSRFAPLLLDYYAAHPQAIQPEAMRATVMGMLQAGLDDISVSRLASKLQWGIDVPGDDEHKVYVWLDALNIYLTGARAATARARTQGTIEDLLARASSAYSGPTAANTRPSTPETAALLADVEAHAAEARADPALAPFATDCDPFWPSGTQIIGKDIVKFHCIYWPAFLLAAGLPLPEKTLAHSHWTVEGQKMSKSLGTSRHKRFTLCYSSILPCPFLIPLPSLPQATCSRLSCSWTSTAWTTPATASCGPATSAPTSTSPRRTSSAPSTTGSATSSATSP